MLQSRAWSARVHLYLYVCVGPNLRTGSVCKLEEEEEKCSPAILLLLLLLQTG